MSKTSEIMSIARRRNYRIPIDDGEWFYCIIEVTKDTIVDMPELLEKQLKAEHKYGWYVTVFSRKSEYYMDNLPVFGDSKRYVTKWLYPDMEEAVKRDIRDRGMNIYNRIMEFEGNKELI